MKPLQILPFIFLFLFSCSDDEAAKSVDIEHTWRVERAYTDYYDMGYPMLDLFGTCTDGNTWGFSDDGSLTWTDVGEMEWEICDSMPSRTLIGTWSMVSDDTLATSFVQQKHQWVIEELNDTSLILRYATPTGCLCNVHFIK